MHATAQKRQQGSALLVLLALILVAISFVILKALNSDTVSGRAQTTAANMSRAKEALIGFAAAYRETHPGQINGFLPLPDLGTSRNNSIITGEGRAAANFAGNIPGLSVAGRLPWQTLGLAPLRDGDGECLWYAVSGSFQDNQKTIKFMNWDTLGQFDLYSSDGTATGTVSSIGTNYHQRPAAVIIAPGSVTTGQTRTLSTVDTVTECSGNYDARNYLDTFNANPLLGNIVNYFAGAPNSSTETFTFAAPKKIVAGDVSDASGNQLSNDMVLAITPDDIFRIIKQRNDFAAFVTNDLLGAVKSNLSAALPAPATINFTTVPPTETAGGAVVGSLEIGRVPNLASVLTTDDQRAWQDNLLYARCTSGTGCLTVNGTANCSGVVIFPGDRLAAQTRASDAQKNTWSNYLEGTVLTAFTTGATVFNGPAAYNAASSTSDVVACIPYSAASQTSFAADFGSFIKAGSGITADAASQTVTITSAAGTHGGCFWLPSTVALAGKTVRAYYEYQFTQADTFALHLPKSKVKDRGNGITLDIVDGTQGSPTSSCGLESNMGAFEITDGIGTWAGQSFIIETDIYQDAANNDSVENHTAIMANGNLAHSNTNGKLTAACNGTAAGCQFNPADTFEESPAPLLHNQRVEIHSGCNSTCSSCNPANHTAPNTYVKISTWVDCAACNDVTTDSTVTPTINRCIILNPAMNSSYVSLTGGFRSGASAQGVTLSNFILRSD